MTCSASRHAYAKSAAPNEAVELTGRPDSCSVTAPLSFSAVIMLYTAFEMLGQSYRVSAPTHAAAEL